jgi:hypothetical protein
LGAIIARVAALEKAKKTNCFGLFFSENMPYHQFATEFLSAMSHQYFSAGRLNRRTTFFSACASTAHNATTASSRSAAKVIITSCLAWSSRVMPTARSATRRILVATAAALTASQAGKMDLTSALTMECAQCHNHNIDPSS